MKISILSDFHFGFGAGTERSEDAFHAAEEALDKSLDSDVILIAGDIFDTKAPGTDNLIRAMQLFAKPLFRESETKILEGIGKDIQEFTPMTLSGIPIVAIHGTHERRIKGLMNPVEALEKAGFLVYLHCNGVVLEKEGERVCVQGMSGIPDQFAEGVLKEWNPKPLQGCFNVLMFHQSLSEFLYAPNAIEISRFPEGFDLYICGHMHESKKSSYGNSPLFIPGSPITTQITKESVQPRGFWRLEIKDRKIISQDFVELEKQRKVYYRVFDSENLDSEKLTESIKDILKERQEKKPLVRIKLTGKEKTLPLEEIRKKFEQEAIVSFKKEFLEERPDVKSLEEHRFSVQELGRKILRENLEKEKLNPKVFEHFFELLEENRPEDAMDFLSEGFKKDTGEKNG